MKYFDLLKMPQNDQNQLSVKCDALEENGYKATATLFRSVVIEGPLQSYEGWNLMSPFLDEYTLASMDVYEGPTRTIYDLFTAPYL